MTFPDDPQRPADNGPGVAEPAVSEPVAPGVVELMSPTVFFGAQDDGTTTLRDVR